DLYIDEGYDLSEYGLDAKVLHIPGHSKGSIGILTADGDLFCGDLFENKDKPVLNSIMDDLMAANASVEKLKSLNINTVYPGHGKPFPMEILIKKFKQNVHK
ncbi:MAG: MBL fold metallo-hydrolase, partial [Thermoplasmata archaeon]